MSTVYADVPRATALEPGLFARTRRCEILCMASADEVAQWVDELILSTDLVAVVRAPELGMVMMQIQEPVAYDSFYLGEVLVTRAEVEIAGRPGWSMRMGDDPVGALGCALLDAWAVSSNDAANDVDMRCAALLAARWQREIEEWEELRKTEVRFDELESDRTSKDRR
jgi:alpha-D-ribose 1-methylphosphonate 5-triphosphate synthase subunit PhnG